MMQSALPPLTCSNFVFDTDLDLVVPRSTSPPDLKWRPEPHTETAKKIPPYIKTLYDLTSSPDTDAFIRWTKDGLYMYIVDADRLCDEIQRGRYFRSSKFTSVVRNLNYHRFKKMRLEELPLGLRCEVDAVAATMPTATSRHLFFHPCFQRDRIELLGCIKGKARAHHQGEAPSTRDLEAENDMLKQIVSERDSEITFLRAHLRLALGHAPTGAFELMESNKRPRGLYLPPAHQPTQTVPSGGIMSDFTWGDLLQVTSIPPGKNVEHV